MTQEDLARRIDRSKNFAIALIVVVFAAYAVKFWVIAKFDLSSDTGAWGQFGDYVGGLLNPIIAYLAFYWLTQSILLQREELADTKKALQESAKTQLRQEQLANKAAKINALSALLTSHNNDISNLRSNMEFVSSQLSGGGIVQTPLGDMVGPPAAQSLMKEMKDGLQAALQRRMVTMDEITALIRNDV